MFGVGRTDVHARCVKATLDIDHLRWAIARPSWSGVLEEGELSNDYEWGVLEVSEALEDTGLSGKMRSTIWEWSQSLQGSGNNKTKKKELLKKIKKCVGTFWYIVLS